MQQLNPLLLIHLVYKLESPAQGVPGSLPPLPAAWLRIPAPSRVLLDMHKVNSLLCKPMHITTPLKSMRESCLGPSVCITDLQHVLREAEARLIPNALIMFCECIQCVRRMPNHSESAEGIAEFRCRINYEIKIYSFLEWTVTEYLLHAKHWVGYSGCSPSCGDEKAMWRGNDHTAIVSTEKIILTGCFSIKKDLCRKKKKLQASAWRHGKPVCQDGVFIEGKGS